MRSGRPLEGRSNPAPREITTAWVIFTQVTEPGLLKPYPLPYKICSKK